MKGIRLCGSGAAVPHLHVSNDDLSARVETCDEWIRTRTGIAARRVADENRNSHQPGGSSRRQALRNAGWDASSVDLILLATSSPDDLFRLQPPRCRR